MTAINTTVGASPFSLSNERQQHMIPGDFITGLVASNVHEDDRHNYTRSLEMEVARLRQGIVGNAFRGRLAYELRIKSRDHIDMPTARRIVDTAMAEALKGGTP